MNKSLPLLVVLLLAAAGGAWLLLGGGSERAAAGTRADELLALFDLTGKREALGGELSRGMRQKLAFCCAWLPRPRLVLLDEPLSGLDPHGIRAAKDAILGLAAEGTAIVLSSHLLGLIEELCSHLLILDGGRPVFRGTLEEARALASEGGNGGGLEELFFAATGVGEGSPLGRELAPADEGGERDVFRGDEGEEPAA